MAKPGIRFKAVLSKLRKLIKYIYATMQIKHVRVCWDNVQQNFQTTVPLEILQSSSNSCLKTATFPPTVGRGSGGLGVPSQLLLWSWAGRLRSSTSASRPRRNIGCGRVQGFSMLRFSACQNLHRFRIFHIPPAWHHPVARSCPQDMGPVLPWANYFILIWEIDLGR